MMLLALLKKEFLIVKKYVLIMFVFVILMPPFIRWRLLPEFTGTAGYILSVIYAVFMLLQYVSLKEYQFPKAAALLCATPFSRKDVVLSKYIFCMAVYALCGIIFQIETLVIPGLGTADIMLYAMMFFVTAFFIGLYLPVQFRLGFEKTRIVFMLIIVASPIALPLILRMEMPGRAFLSAVPPFIFSCGIVLIGAAFLAGSAALSVRIYEKADLA